MPKGAFIAKNKIIPNREWAGKGGNSCESPKHQLLNKRKNTNERPVQCQCCLKRFRKRHGLKLHLRSGCGMNN